MAAHGHARSDLRHLHLHRAALAKLRERPELRRLCLDLVERWLRTPDHAPSRPWLLEWHDMLTDWSVARIERVVLDPDRGQTLRQCSPLGPALSPRERWAVLEQVNRQLDPPAVRTGA